MQLAQLTSPCTIHHSRACTCSNMDVSCDGSYDQPTSAELLSLELHFTRQLSSDMRAHACGSFFLARGSFPRRKAYGHTNSKVACPVGDHELNHQARPNESLFGWSSMASLMATTQLVGATLGCWVRTLENAPCGMGRLNTCGMGEIEYLMAGHKEASQDPCSAEGRGSTRSCLLPYSITVHRLG